MNNDQLRRYLHDGEREWNELARTGGEAYNLKHFGKARFTADEILELQKKERKPEPPYEIDFEGWSEE